VSDALCEDYNALMAATIVFFWMLF